MRIILLVATIVFIGLMILSMTSCAGLTNQQQRVLTGGALGAGGGAAVGALSGGNPATGALLGGAIGAVGGALIPDDQDYPRHPHYRKHRR